MDTAQTSQTAKAGNDLGRLIIQDESPEGEGIQSNLALFQGEGACASAVIQITGPVARALLLASDRSDTGIADKLMLTISRFADAHLSEAISAQK